MALKSGLKSQTNHGSDLFTSILGSPKSNSMSTSELLNLVQNDVKNDRRNQLDLPIDLIDYIFAVASSCGSREKTRYNAVHIMNEYGVYLSRQYKNRGTRPSSKTLQASALACILMSSKLHDSDKVSITKLQEASGYAITRAELTEAELTVLKTINFDIHALLPHDLMEVLLAASKVKYDSEMYSVSTKVLDLIYTKTEYLKKENWILASSAAVYIASSMTNYSYPVLQIVSNLTGLTEKLIKDTVKCFYWDILRISVKETPAHPLAKLISADSCDHSKKQEKLMMNSTEISLFTD